MNVTLHEAKEPGFIFTSIETYCRNEFKLQYKDINNFHREHHSALGMTINKRKFSNVENFVLQNYAHCQNASLLYYQIKIVVMEKDFCPNREMAHGHGFATDHIYSIANVCIKINVHVFRHIYVISQSLSLFDPTDGLSWSCLYLCNRYACGRGYWNIHLINYDTRWTPVFDYITIDGNTYFHVIGVAGLYLCSAHTWWTIKSHNTFSVKHL